MILKEGSKFKLNKKGLKVKPNGLSDDQIYTVDVLNNVAILVRSKDYLDTFPNHFLFYRDEIIQIHNLNRRVSKVNLP